MSILRTLMPAAHVSVDGRTGRPLELVVGGQRLAVTAMEAVRDETAAYSLETGPRTVFLVRSHLRRYRLVHLLRDGRWTIEEVPDGPGLTVAA